MIKPILAAGAAGFVFLHAFANSWVELERWTHKTALIPAYETALKKLNLETIPTPMMPEPPPTPRQMVREETELMGINTSIIFALIDIESRWDSTAVSEKGAIGLMQVMPMHLKFCGLKTKAELFDPLKNIRCGLAVWKELQTKHQDLYTILRGYNCGAAGISNRCEKTVKYIHEFNKALLSEVG